MSESLVPRAGDARRARTRRLTLLLALAAAGVYVGFIVLQVLRARG
ncbi:MAG TPA: hypothetical protein VMT92_05760 [Steroidobacteraceae bacterium]|nr:hypothetical protein [Steroidobacteraceae bacterium]